MKIWPQRGRRVIFWTRKGGRKSKRKAMVTIEEFEEGKQQQHIFAGCELRVRAHTNNNHFLTQRLWNNTVKKNGDGWCAELCYAVNMQHCRCNQGIDMAPESMISGLLCFEGIFQGIKPLCSFEREECVNPCHCECVPTLIFCKGGPHGIRLGTHFLWRELKQISSIIHAIPWVKKK